MRRVDTIIGVVAALFGGFVLTQSLVLGLFQRSEIPGPGFLPAILATALAVLGIALVISRLLGVGADPDEFSRPNGREFGRSITVWLAFLFAILLLESLGFLMASAALIAFLLIGVEQLRSRGAFVTIVTMPVLAYFVFVVMLRVNLPVGPWGF